MNARELAFLAHLAALQGRSYLHEYLSKHKTDNDADNQLAREIANGSFRMALRLDTIAKALSGKQKLSFKKKELALLRTALYQHYFLNKIPDYAIVNESVDLAKKYCSTYFAKFLNAILRKMGIQDLNFLNEFSTSKNSEHLSLYYSYPPYFIEKMIQEYGMDIAKEVMKTYNLPSKTIARFRSPYNPLDFKEITKEEITKLSKSSEIYIQNATPIYLMGELREKFTGNPKTILDLCASPGGKLILAHDFFPKAQLFANDISTEKLNRLIENLEKYQIQATLSISLGEKYRDGLFDLIIVDAPCSNSGVFNKRPEARWRFSKENIEKLVSLQKKLIQNALSLLAPQGELWYLTCSILKEENEEIVKPYSIRTSKLILPNSDGWDGGFGCALRASSIAA